jgi:hypothetical protein
LDDRNHVLGRKPQILIVALAVLFAANVKAQERKDIRSPLAAGPVLTKDLTKETKVPSLELEQVLSAVVQNPMFKLKIVVAKGTPLAAEVEKQVKAKGLINHVQLVEQ